MSAQQKAALAELLRSEDGATAIEMAMVIDLAFNPSQPRGPDGKWIRGAGAAKSLVSEFPGIEHSAGFGHHSDVAMMIHAAATAEARANTAREIQKVKLEHQKDFGKLIEQVRRANIEGKKRDEAQHSKKRALALALHTATVLAGGLIAYVEFKLGASDVTMIASSMGPTMAHDLVDWARRLAA